MAWARTVADGWGPTIRSRAVLGRVHRLGLGVSATEDSMRQQGQEAGIGDENESKNRYYIYAMCGPNTAVVDESFGLIPSRHVISH